MDITKLHTQNPRVKYPMGASPKHLALVIIIIPKTAVLRPLVGCT